MKLKKFLCFILCLMTITAITACEKPKNGPTPNIIETQIGEGEKAFYLRVIGETARAFDVSTNEEFVGVALQNLGIIEGEKGPYGLYVKTVDGETVDFDKDKKYWAFYINDEYATKGIDQTEIEEDAVYLLKVQK